VSEPDAAIVSREMGYTAREFAQVLPRAMRDWVVSGGPEAWQVADSDGVPLVGIRVQALPDRRVGALVLPVLLVTLDLGRTTGDRVAEFLRRFDRGFHRGGG
jgi:hypothetical protein